MRVALITPIGADSAIADVMLQAVPHLVAHWQLDVWSPTTAVPLACPVPLHLYDAPDSRVVEALDAYDLVIHVLGDSDLHAGILPLALAVPGLVVLHDASLTNLVRHTAYESGYLDELVEEMAASFGDDDAAILRTGEAPGGAAGWLRFCAQHALDDRLLQASLGVVVHSAWHAARVGGHSLGEVTVAPLPVPSNELVDDGPVWTGANLLESLPQDDLLLVTVGAANANRHIDLLLAAMAADPATSSRLRLWAVGGATEQQAAELTDQAAALGIAERFLVTGRVSDAALHLILDRADMAAALRDPVLEGQSASVLTQMLAGVPVVVYDHAHYAELPDDAVVKVAPEADVDGVVEALRLLALDEADRKRRGQHAQEYVSSSRGGPQYAAALLEAGNRALAARPHVHVTSDVADQLARLDLHTVPEIVRRSADHLFELYDLG